MLHRCCRQIILLTLFLGISHIPLYGEPAGPQPANSAEAPAPAINSPDTATTGKPSQVLTIPQRTLAPFASAGSFTSRVLTEDTLWKGAILVEGMVTVAPQATLTVAPGTVVRFGADSGLMVLGRIVVKGTTEAPVTLTSQYLEPRPNDWFGIVIAGSSKKNALEQAAIHGAETAVHGRYSSLELRNLRIDSSSIAINLVDSLANLRNIAVAGCGTGLAAVKSEIDLDSMAIDQGKAGITLKSSGLTAEKLKISSVTGAAFVADKAMLKIDRGLFSGNMGGARITDSEGSISSSKFVTNTDTAVIISGSLLRFNSNLVSGNRVGVQLEDNLPALWGNSISGNSGYNVLYLGDGKLFAGGNWLGAANSESFSKFIYSKIPDALQTFPLLAADPLNNSLKDF